MHVLCTGQLIDQSLKEPKKVNLLCINTEMELVTTRNNL